ncbi:uncharacterized protein BDZ99DRAFT_458771 [Mytilinidion resinicola]|uniref:Uncharacterized protein n=1 Tax=Mytilinidion resinicola TaxID=574789 RepID=A0A6A6Z247_9PEZI|nr:uncharacterized protein BDZ99DRAFT_458771 [Mytilinidion resinicola]KAF2814789.1 hypothetical protein BDZ99DRAFT_458771 [Mytilinidion resinicola]
MPKRPCTSPLLLLFSGLQRNYPRDDVSPKPAIDVLQNLLRLVPVPRTSTPPNVIYDKADRHLLAKQTAAGNRHISC